MKIKVCQLCAVDFAVSKFLLPLIDEMEKNGWHIDIICSEGKYSDDLKKKVIILNSLKLIGVSIF